MPSNSLFSTYRKGENRVTASMLAVFERIGMRLVEQLLAAASGESTLELVTFRNQIVGQAAAVPDAEISANFRYLFETKTGRDEVKQNQLLQHLKHFNSQYSEERLFVLTPDTEKPGTIPDDLRVVWFNFLALSQAIDSVLYGTNEMTFENDRFLLQELQALFEADGLLLVQEDTVVVPARDAYPMYKNLDYKAYACQVGRTFPAHIKRLAFYADGEIKPQVPHIISRYDDVEFTMSEVERRLSTHDNDEQILANLIKEQLGKRVRAEGSTQQVFLLTSPNDNPDSGDQPNSVNGPDSSDRPAPGSQPTSEQQSSSVDSYTILLKHAIPNTKIDHNGKPTAWVQKQRYVRVKALQDVANRNGTTDDLDKAR